MTLSAPCSDLVALTTRARKKEPRDVLRFYGCRVLRFLKGADFDFTLGARVGRQEMKKPMSLTRTYGMPKAKSKPVAG
jgi:hypothetical protein